MTSVVNTVNATLSGELKKTWQVFGLPAKIGYGGLYMPGLKIFGSAWAVSLIFHILPLHLPLHRKLFKAVSQFLSECNETQPLTPLSPFWLSLLWLINFCFLEPS